MVCPSIFALLKILPFLIAASRILAKSFSVLSSFGIIISVIKKVWFISASLKSGFSKIKSSASILSGVLILQKSALGPSFDFVLGLPDLGFWLDF